MRFLFKQVVGYEGVLLYNLGNNKVMLHRYAVGLACISKMMYNACGFYSDNVGLLCFGNEVLS